MEVGGLVGPLVALAAGALSFFSPCVLPLVPAYLARMAGVATAGDGCAARRQMVLHAASFVGGLSLVFVALGASIGLVGFALVDRVPLLLQLAGALVIVFGLHMTALLRIPTLYLTVEVSLPGASRAGYVGSAFVGSAFALGWTPCVGPVLGSILALAATSRTAGHGALLLAFYSAGLGVQFLIASVMAGSLVRLVRGLGPRLALIERAGGALLIVMGILLVTNTLSRLNQYAPRLGIG